MKKLLKAILTQSEVDLYGSSRLGILTQKTQSVQLVTLSGDFGNARLDVFTRNKKVFELNNHPGNVLSTISDAKISVASIPDSSLIDHYRATVLSARDYHPFGMQMPGRNYKTGACRYGLTGRRLTKR